MKNLKHTTKVKSLIQGEVSIGTCALVELEVRELEQVKNDLLEALIELRKETLSLIEHCVDSLQVGFFNFR